MNLKLEYDSFQDFANRLWPCLCEEGMWVASEHPASPGQLVDFDVMLADGFRLFHGTGQVIAVGAGPSEGPAGEGMTLRFSQLDQPSRNLVRKVVSKHIGEGGKLFVLSAPATKIEVVGGEEGDGEGEGPTGDLVAPFAGLEDDAWNEDSEPELSSFLRPSSRPLEDAAQELAAAEAVTESIDEVELEDSLELEGPSTPSAAEVDLETEIPELDLNLEVADEEPPIDGGDDDLWPEPAIEPDSAPIQSGPLDLGEADTAVDEIEQWDAGFDPANAATQRVEPLSPLATDEPTSFDDESFEPLPSTVMPPALPDQAGDYGSEGEPEEADTDEFFYQGDGPQGRTWWPIVVIGGLIVGAGIFALSQLDTPLSGLFGGGDDSGERAIEAVPPPRPRTAQGTTGPASGPAISGADEGSLPGDSQGETGVGAGERLTQATTGSSGDAGDAAPSAGSQSSAPATESATPPRPRAGASGSPRTPAPAATAPTSPPASATADAAPVGTAGEPAAALSALRLRRVTWREVEGDTVIRLALAGDLSLDRVETLRVAGGNPRHVLKITGVSGRFPRAPVAIGSDEVTQLRFGIHNVGGARQVHMVIDLADEAVAAKGSAQIVDGGVELRFSSP